jgi:hypothetical protein
MKTTVLMQCHGLLRKYSLFLKKDFAVGKGQHEKRLCGIIWGWLNGRWSLKNDSGF